MKSAVPMVWPVVREHILVGTCGRKKKKVIHFKTRLLSFEEAKEAEVPFKAAVTY